jgi:hypothetical protein
MSHYLNYRHVAALLTCVALAACEGESSPADPNPAPEPPALNEIVSVGPIDASALDALAYFSLESGTIVAQSAAWDLALRRYEVRLNGGISGTRGVTGFALDNNRNATDAEIIALTPANTLAAFDAVRAGAIPAESEFGADRLVANSTGYLNLGGVPTANAAASWKVRTAGGGYALMRVTAITMSPAFALTSVTVESRLQNGATLGPVQSVAVPVAGAPVSIHLATNSAVAQNGCNWDVMVNPQSFGISLNAGCGAGTFPGGATPAFADVTSAADAPEYGGFLSGLSGPVPNSITDPGAPFRYNLQGDNRLNPTFNTYLVRSGSSVYKLQVINYYNASGAGGYPTIRYARIR